MTDISPTDAQINRLVHEKLLGEEYEFSDASRREFKDIPDYCNDRNALPDVYTVLLCAHKHGYFIEELNLYGEVHWHTAWRYIVAHPKVQVIAALKALGKWPADWRTE